MEKAKYITKDGVSLLAAHILSFETEKDFIKEYDPKVYKRLDQKERKRKLKEIYAEAKKAV